MTSERRRCHSDELLLRHGPELHLTWHKRHVSAVVGSQIVTMAPAASGLHHCADVVSSRRSETASMPWRCAPFPRGLFRIFSGLEVQRAWYAPVYVLQ